MSRPLRIQFPGAWYHVMNRDRRRENIFLDKSDYQAFVNNLEYVDLEESPGLYPWSSWDAYCIHSKKWGWGPYRAHFI